MWNLKYGTDELIYETETNSQREREQSCGHISEVWVCFNCLTGDPWY